MRLTQALVRRVAATAFAAAAIAAAAAGPVYAAAPTNDSYADRVASDVPFSTYVDTSEATTDADDAALNTLCGAPATDASIWYEVTAPSDGGMLIDVNASYSGGAIVATGGPGAWTLVRCGPGGFSWNTVAGTRYTILVFDDQDDGVGNGGALHLSVDVISPPPVLDITVNPRAQFTKSGEAIVSGTVNCHSPAALQMQVSLSQRIGRIILRGDNSFEMLCDGTERPWSTGIVAYTGKFAGGQAASVTFGYACGWFECSLDYEERTVQLSRAG